jgi:hypothetical protein
MDDLFEFLKACENGEALGESRNRAFYNQIHVLEAGQGGRREISYSLGFGDNVWKDAGNVYGGTILQGNPPGNPIPLNNIFYSILLARSPMSKLGEPSLVLAIPTTDDGEKNADLREQLLKAVRLIPKLDGAQTRYFLTGFEFDGKKEAPRLCGVEIGDVDQNQFDYAAFRAAASNMVKLFVPAWNRSRCHLYVEWGFRYPKVEEFYRLFDEVQAAGPKPILLISRGPAVGGPDGTNWHEPIWHLVAEESCKMEFHPYATLGLDAKLPFIKYKEASSLAVPPMTLGLGPASETVGEANALERKIGSLERELEWLYARRDRVRQAAQREYLPIYVWEQADAPGLGPLPSGLNEFLTRSHGELSQFDYLAVTSPGGLTWHCLAGQAPVTQGTGLAVPCDRLYLSEARWREWQFPLFVRADCALSIDVDEAAVADRVLALLRNEKADESKHWILAESTAADGAPGQIQFLLLPNEQAKNVLDSLSYITAFGQGAASTASLAGALTLGAVAEHNVAAPARVRELDGLLQERARQMIGEIQGLWENLRVDCQKNRIEMILAQVAIYVTRKAYQQHPAVWKEFVDEALKMDEVLAELKITALDRWAKNNGERDDILAGLAQRRSDVEGLIAEHTVKFEGAATELDRQLTATEASLGKLREARTRLEGSRERLVKTHAALEGELQELDKKIQEFVLQRDAYVADRKKLENAEAEIEKMKLEVEEARTQVAAESAQLEQMKLSLAEEQAALEQTKVPLAEEQARFQAERAAFESLRQAVSGAGSLPEADWAALNEEKLRFCSQPVPPRRRGIMSRIKSLWS